MMLGTHSVQCGFSNCDWHTDKKSKSSANSAAKTASSPSEPFHELDELPRETFTKGYPMVDAPALTSCKWCKKSILMTTAVEHINGCLKIKKEKANRKKAAREARERAKEAALREERERRAEEEGITLGADGDSGDDDDDGEKVPGKTTKKVAGKKTGEGGPSGKKRKAEGEADKGPKQKKKKDEPKPKTKPKGESTNHLFILPGRGVASKSHPLPFAIILFLPSRSNVVQCSRPSGPGTAQQTPS